MTLAGLNTYTGNTTVTGGTLNINGGWTGSATASNLTYGASTTAIVNVSSNMTLANTIGSSTSTGVSVYNQTAGTVNYRPIAVSTGVRRRCAPAATVT